jgi:hypothetical protein
MTIKRDIQFYSFGNGISIVDLNHMESGDYLKVGHISFLRNVTIRVDLADEDRELIALYASKANPTRSTSQPDQYVFAQAPTDESIA